MGLLSKIFGAGPKGEELQEMLANGAVVIDVRSTEEFRGGNVPGSKNVPLPEISSKVAKLKSLGKPIVLCCASGMRSGKATRILKAEGLDCVNGGGWRQVLTQS